VLAALDPNWFYSTLAQSTAAIVGRAGGFLAQRLVAQRGDLGGERFDLREKMRLRFNEMEAQRPALNAVVNSMNTNLTIVEDAEKHGQSEVRLQRDFITTLSHGPNYTTPGEERWSVQTAMRYLVETRDAAQALLASYPSTLEAFIDRASEYGSLETHRRSWLREPPGEKPAEGINFENVYRWMPFQRALAQEQFRHFDRETEAFRTSVGSLRAKLLPKSLFALLAILTGLLLVGLIAPLFFLSAPALRRDRFSSSGLSRSPSRSLGLSASS
jgi:hypothetical protein